MYLGPRYLELSGAVSTRADRARCYSLQYTVKLYTLVTANSIAATLYSITATLYSIALGTSTSAPLYVSRRLPRKPSNGARAGKGTLDASRE